MSSAEGMPDAKSMHMRERRSKVLARTGFLFIIVGIVLVLYGLGQDRLKLELGFLLMALAVVMIEIAVALGWDAFADFHLVMQRFRRNKASLSRSVTAQDARARSHLRPTIKTHIWLLSLSCIGMVAAIVLELLKMVRGLPFWGDATIDTIAYFCVGAAALFYLLRFALDGVFFLWGRRKKRKKGRKGRIIGEYDAGR